MVDEPADRTQGPKESLWDAAIRDAFAAGEAARPASVFERLEGRLLEEPSRVRLPVEEGVEETAVVLPSRGAATDTGRCGRFLVLGEIARGGIGVILHGRDEDLGRDVAIKVLQDRYATHAPMVHRFLEEAQIGGQLQHPGVLPVYDMGIDRNGRPFFTMKLVRGRTLSALLRERSGGLGGVEMAAGDLMRFLHVLEQVAQTLAYAHARGVIHRDVKPANVMVGAFGEVQVMDWGMAKVLARGGIHDETRQLAEDALTVVETVRSTGVESSVAGVVLGTPSYMPPEQAQGQIDRVDERADVFALGAMLCEILTGLPPYVRQPGSSAIEQAQSASLNPARDRLQGSGADPDLVRLALTCLEPEVSRRPRDARVVADHLRRWMETVNARADEARMNAATAVARASSERRARRLTQALAGLVVVVLASAGGLIWWNAWSRQEALDRQNQRVRQALSEARRLASLDLAEAEAALRVGDEAVRLGPVDPALAADWAEAAQELRQGFAEQRVQSERLARDQAFVVRLREIRNQPVEGPGAAEEDYNEAFREFGLDPIDGAPDAVAAFIRAQPPAVAGAVLSALDDWASRLRLNGLEIWRDVVRLAQAADDDPWRRELRGALLLDDDAKLRALAESVGGESSSQDAASLVLLAVSLDRRSDRESAVALLRSASRSHPEDYWVHQQLALVLAGGILPPAFVSQPIPRPEPTPAELQEARGHLQAALALQPESGTNQAFLARVLQELGETAEAKAYLSEARRRRPDDPELAVAEARWDLEAGEEPKAMDGLRAVLRRRPGFRPAERLMRHLLESRWDGPPDPRFRLEELGGSSSDSAAVFEERARLALALGRPESAVEAAAAAVALPGGERAGSILLRGLLELGRYEEVLGYLEGRVFPLLPDEVIHLEREARGRRLAATTGARRPGEPGARPDGSDRRRHLGEVRLLEGRAEEALALLSRSQDARSPRGEGAGPGPRGGPSDLGLSVGRAAARVVVDHGSEDQRRSASQQARSALERGLSEIRDGARPGGRRRPPAEGRREEGGVRPDSRYGVYRWRHDERLDVFRDEERLTQLVGPDESRAWQDLWGRVESILSRP